jgi:hypothetical protein
MADFTDLKKKRTNKKNRFGSPLSEEEASTTLEAPEHAPTNKNKKGSDLTIKKSRAKTGRTIAFSTRVGAEFNDDFRNVAFMMKMKKVDLLEECLRAYKKANKL